MGEKNRPMVSGYSEAGASHTRRALRGFTATSASPNADINWQESTLRQRGRMLYMSSPIAASAIKTNRTKVVGVGLTLKSTIDADAVGMSPEEAKKWQRLTEKEFSLWANKRQNFDAIGMNSFAGMQQLVVMSWLMSGDVFALFQREKETLLNPYTLRVHLIEADRVSTPYNMTSRLGSMSTDGTNPKNGNAVYDGVEVNEQGMVLAYHICNAYPTEILRGVKDIKWQRVSAYGRRTGMPNILHIMDSERPDQYRGVTYLAPVIESLLNISRYTQSELMAALIQSFFTAWVKTTTNPNQIPFGEVGPGEEEPLEGQKPQDTNLSDDDNEYEMGPGTVIHLKPDEEITFGNPNIPTQGFDVFFKVICKEIGAALEIPYDTLLKEFNASYSASRAALMEAWEAFRMRREQLVSMFCQPVYEAWLAEAVAIGRIHAPGFFSDPGIRQEWCRAQWLGPVQGQLDPTKEIEADILAVQHGFKTHDQVTREYGGGDWTDNTEQLKQENELLQVANMSASNDSERFSSDSNKDGGNENGDNEQSQQIGDDA